MKRLLFAMALLLAAPALSVQPNEMLADPALEARARVISEGLRCVVCQNQSIDDSDAPLAKDLRLVVREQLMLGKTDADVTAYIVSRYGNFVLLKPPVEPATWALWAGPFAVLFIGGAGVALWSRRRRSEDEAPLTAAEIAEIDRLG
jgi:cytochrome c-type biogenesis protein CcmH